MWAWLKVALKGAWFGIKKYGPALAEAAVEAKIKAKADAKKTGAALLLALLVAGSASAQIVQINGPYVSGAGVARGPILAPDGSAAAPSYSFVNATSTGWYLSGSALAISTSGVQRAYFDGSGLTITGPNLTGSSTNTSLNINKTLNTTGVVDGVFRVAVTNTASGAGSYIAAFYGGPAGATREFSVGMTGNVETAGSYYATTGSLYVASIGALRFDTRSQFKSSASGAIEATANDGLSFTTFNYGPTTGNTRGSSAWNNGLVTIDMATATGTGTGTITSPNTAIPVGVYHGMTCKVTTILAGAGLTTISIGDGTDVDRWGAGIAIAAGTTINVANWTAMPPWTYQAATSIVVTADAGVLSTGVLSCTPHSFTFSPIGS